MRHSILVSVFLCSVFSSFSQGLIVDDCIVLKRGIYRNFEEFKRNNPGLQQEFTVEPSTRGYGMLNAELHPVVKMVLTNPASLTKKDSVWGFCDGQNIYISTKKRYTKRTKYDRIHFLGRYCYFESVDYVSTYYPGMMVMTPMAATGTSGGMMMMGGGGSNRVLSGLVININNGGIFVLTKSTLKEILQNDPEMLAAFNDEKKKKTKLYEYVKMYSKKHADQIKR